MKRKQKHYTSEQQIIDKIDEAREKSDSLNRQAELLESNSAEAIKNGNTHLINELRKQAITCRKQARRIEEVKLPLLGEALSEFRTAPIIPILGQDLSVASLVYPMLLVYKLPALSKALARLKPWLDKDSYQLRPD
jgi:hypothetical protein